MANILKKILLGSMVVLGASAYAAAEDALLLWMLDDPEIGGVHGELTPYSIDNLHTAYGMDGNPATHARVAVFDGDTNVAYLDFWYNNGSALVDKPTVSSWAIDEENAAGPTWANIGDYTAANYKFMIEIGNYANGSWAVMAKSEQASYADLVSGGYITPGEISMPGHLPWTGGNYVIPEPSTGLLFLLGAALCGLRRKRRLNA